MSAIVGGVIQESSTVYHCNNLTYDESSMDYWNQYNDVCVSESPLLPTIYSDMVHDSACCYAYTVDGFDVYDNELTTDNVINGIRVY